MKQRSTLLFQSLTILLILMTSCRAPKDLEYRDFKNIQVEKVDFSSSILRMDLIYYNPNNFGLQLKRTDLDIYLDNNFLGHTEQEYQISIPKRGEFALPIQIQVDMKNVLKNAFNTLVGKDVMVKITGTVKLGKLNVYKSFPVNYEGSQKFSLF